MVWYECRSEPEVTYLIILIANSTSIVACVLILLIYIFAKKLRVYAFTLVSYVAFCDLIKSASMLLPTYNHSSKDFICQFQAILYQYFALGSFLLTLVMSSSLYLCVVKKYEGVEKYHLISVLLVFTLSGIGTGQGLYFDSYGRANEWCWIEIEYTGSRFISFYLPLWIINAANTYMYYYIIKSLKKFNDASMKRLRFYPFILIFCYMPATLHRFFEAIGYPSPYYLVLMTAIGDGLSGLLNSICYGFTQHVRDFIWELFRFKSKYSYRELLKFEDA
jgi:Slime mold cyclic AMP receptor